MTLLPWKKLSRMPLVDIRKLQDNLLAAYLREDVIPFHAHYGRTLPEAGYNPKSFRGSRDLRHLPFTTKADITKALSEDPTSFLLKPTPEKIKAHWPLARLAPLGLRKAVTGEQGARRALEKEFLPIFMTATTGRAANPVPFLYSAADLRRLAVAGDRIAQVLQCDSSDRLLNLFPYAPHLAFWQVAFAGMEAGIFILSTGGGKTIGTIGNIRALERIKPSGLLGVPSYLYHVLRTAEAEGAKMPNLKKIILGAEKVPETLRGKLVELAGRCGAADVKVMGTYGFTEAKTAWTECPGQSGYHLFPDMGVFEIVNPETLEPVHEGESGEIVYTALGARGSVVVRYRTGDYADGGIISEPCPFCGSTVPRLTSKITRLSNHADLQLTKVKGTLVDLNHFAALLSEQPEIEEWQIVLRKRNNDPHDVDELVLYVAPMPGKWIDRAKLERVITEATEVKPNEIIFEKMEDLIRRIGLETEMKEKRLLDIR